MSRIYRKTYAEVNLTNIYKNYSYIQNAARNIKVIPVVKANAYGHGCIEVVDLLASIGVDQFAVSLLEEGLKLRSKFPDIEILIMGIVDDEGLIIASENDMTITISNFDQIEKLSNLSQILKIHLKIDTGMNRLGFKSDKEIKMAFKLLKSNKFVELDGIYTHFSTADVDKLYYDIQLNRFKYILDMLKYTFRMVHMSNSSSLIKYENDIDFTTHARLGISLYGLTLDSNVNFLKTTFKLKTSISQIRHLEPGDKVGYGATYVASQSEVIGILPIGYADGFIRRNKGGDVEINGRRYPIIGNICMDQMFIKIDESIRKTDEVTLFGGLITIDEVAKRLDTINYEIICQITSRVPRKYIK
ncbi:Alanine racemase [Candidatus Izimaplasma bacterium HR1]|jgi:alanine racemase|uniref:alanine racemase n=1 Tax=Candidatus Izimoplasma sp. HR1 TaxID=1541959 RepID=UPI0004F5E91B|nr:Alanine racemase [Candidatus Izimaplasma bacterium HR1]